MRTLLPLLLQLAFEITLSFEVYFFSQCHLLLFSEELFLLLLLLSDSPSSKPKESCGKLFLLFKLELDLIGWYSWNTKDFIFPSSKGVAFCVNDGTPFGDQDYNEKLKTLGATFQNSYAIVICHSMESFDSFFAFQAGFACSCLGFGTF